MSLIGSTITALGPPAVGVAAKKILNELVDYAKSYFSQPDRIALKALSSLDLGKRIYSTINVKTLWNVEKEVSLFEFYYPSRVVMPGDELPKMPQTASELSGGLNFVLQGTAGQGKSIYLRYLYGQQAFVMPNTGILPLFIELRRVTAGKSVVALLGDAFERLGLPVNELLVNTYLGSGKIILLLDGFDEIEPDFVDSVVYELEHLLAKHEKLSILVSSRPEASIQRSSFFRVIKLDPLRASDHKPFLAKICGSNGQADEIYEAIQSQQSALADLLRTPLLLTLLVILYRAQSTLPSTLSRFYEQLFDVMFFRHDQTKPGFRRTRYTDLDESKLKQLFEAFSFQTQVAGRQVFSNDEFVGYLSQAQEYSGITVSASGFQKELTKTACLLVQDGVELSFIHKSVAEYYAAAFVQHSSQDFAESFYAQLRKDSLHFSYRGELSYLAEIDQYRYLSYFLAPELKDTLLMFQEDIHGSMDQKIQGFVDDRIAGIFVNLSRPSDEPEKLNFAGISVQDSSTGLYAEKILFCLLDSLFLRQDKIVPICIEAAGKKLGVAHGEVKFNLNELPKEILSDIRQEMEAKLNAMVVKLEAELKDCEVIIARELSKQKLVPLLRGK